MRQSGGWGRRWAVMMATAAVVATGWARGQDAAPPERIVLGMVVVSGANLTSDLTAFGRACVQGTPAVNAIRPDLNNRFLPAHSYLDEEAPISLAVGVTPAEKAEVLFWLKFKDEFRAELDEPEGLLEEDNAAAWRWTAGDEDGRGELVRLDGAGNEEESSRLYLRQAGDDWWVASPGGDWAEVLLAGDETWRPAPLARNLTGRVDCWPARTLALIAPILEKALADMTAEMAEKAEEAATDNLPAGQKALAEFGLRLAPLVPGWIRDCEGVGRQIEKISAEMRLDAERARVALAVTPVAGTAVARAFATETSAERTLLARLPADVVTVVTSRSDAPPPPELVAWVQRAARDIVARIADAGQRDAWSQLIDRFAALKASASTETAYAMLKNGDTGEAAVIQYARDDTAQESPALLRQALELVGPLTSELYAAMDVPIALTIAVREHAGEAEGVAFDRVDMAFAPKAGAPMDPMLRNFLAQASAAYNQAFGAREDVFIMTQGREPEKLFAQAVRALAAEPPAGFLADAKNAALVAGFGPMPDLLGVSYLRDTLYLVYRPMLQGLLPEAQRAAVFGVLDQLPRSAAPLSLTGDLRDGRFVMELVLPTQAVAEIGQAGMAAAMAAMAVARPPENTPGPAPVMEEEEAF